MQALYDWAFSADGCLIKDPEKDVRLFIMPGDKVRVFSDRHQCWFEDGVIEATYRDSIRVRYGLDRYFGFALTKGNTKYLKTAEINSKVRLRTDEQRIVLHNAAASKS